MESAGVERETMSAEQVFTQVGETSAVPKDVSEVTVELATMLAGVGAVEPK